MADKYKMKYFETSAKTGYGVSEAFMDIADTYVKNKLDPFIYFGSTGF